MKVWGYLTVFFENHILAREYKQRMNLLWTTQQLFHSLCVACPCTYLNSCLFPELFNVIVGLTQGESDRSDGENECINSYTLVGG